MLDSQIIANAFTALAHPSRVDIFKCLLAHHPNGLSAGALAAETKLAPSTLSHHLREMESSGVVNRSPLGQSTITVLDLTTLLRVMTSLTQLCCSIDQPKEQGTAQ